MGRASLARQIELTDAWEVCAISTLSGTSLAKIAFETTTPWPEGCSTKCGRALLASAIDRPVGTESIELFQVPDDRVSAVYRLF